MRIGLLVGTTLHPLAGTAWVSDRVHSAAAALRITPDHEVQEDALVRAAYRTRRDRGNLAVEISFTTSRQFSTVELAEVWAQDYDATMPRAGTLVTDPTTATGFPSVLTIGEDPTDPLTDGTDPVTFAPMSYAGIADLRPSYGAALVATCRWYADTSTWALTDIDSGATWESADDVSSPDLCTTWTPEVFADGTPIVTATYPGRRYYANAVVLPPTRQLEGRTILLSYTVRAGACSSSPP